MSNTAAITGKIAAGQRRTTQIVVVAILATGCAVAILRTGRGHEHDRGDLRFRTGSGRRGDRGAFVVDGDHSVPRPAGQDEEPAGPDHDVVEE